MTFSVADLVAELKVLRRGRGIQAPYIADRIGPAVRAICSITENDDPAAVRQKVTARLRDLSSRLSPDLRIGVTAAFALDDGLHTQFYKDRLVWAENALERNNRTVRRRIDEAIVALAELAAHRLAPGEPAGGGRWHNAEIRQALVLDQAAPDVLELRRIVADEDGLTELDLALTVTGTTGIVDRVGLDVLYGGRLRQRRMESTDRIGYRLVLPEPLALGAEHEFALRVRPGADRAIERHFVCVPRHRCDLCEVRVRFPEDRPPARLERLTAVFQRDVVDPNCAADPIELDPSGEVRARFTHLTPGLAYGVRWLSTNP
ncbi:MAG TPA: hypothetical protein VHH15_06025 [Actinophytocola sp.]|nr:hypothetical protein [Actinophytocola sp.]